MTATQGATETPARAGARAGAPRPEQTRARYPDAEGHVERDGVRIFWERYGDGERTVLLLPTWSIVHSRFWKAQIAYLSRHARVVTFDGRGNGRSDRPSGAQSYTPQEFAADAVAVLDAVGAQRASLVSLSCGALWATLLAANHPERIDRVVYIGPAVGLVPGYPEREVHVFDAHYDEHEGWGKYTSEYWREDYRDFLEFFFARCFNEPHSTKQIEDCIGWALDTDPETLADATRGTGARWEEPLPEVCARVRCPTLVIHGDNDVIRPLAQGAELARITGGELVVLDGSGHIPLARDPVRVNHLLRDFLVPPGPPPRWRRARSRTRRALFISSPIGLGHARRDLAIAQALRARRPDLEIDWLAQPPVTAVLDAHGERVHPASALLASESVHIDSEGGGHALPVFDALRRMDEILVANFMVFDDLVREEAYDLWIGDEAWELDYFLHENPELKRASYAWLTDFVGYLPLDDADERAVTLTADYNAEMIEQIARYPRIRDRSIFVGDPEDIAPHHFGPGLPPIRPWTEDHYSFSGYVTGFDPDALGDRAALRAQLGYRPDERVCIVTVGGSGVGADLLEKVMASYPQAKRLVPGLRMIVVAGPRIALESLPEVDGLDVRAFVPDLYRHLAVCDLALVQGGLATTMELTAARRPFVYFPLAGHFEQNIHVRHRLERHGAGRRMVFADATPGAIAEVIAQEIGREVDYLPVTRDGAQRAAGLIAELL